MGGTCTCKKCGAQATTIDEAACRLWINTHSETCSGKKQTTKIKESDLTKIVKRIIEEQKTKGDKPTQDCSSGDKNCSSASCSLQFSIVADGTYPDGTDRVRAEWELCGTGTMSIKRNWPQPGTLVMSSTIDCPSSFTTGGMYLPIATDPQHSAYVNMVVFEIVFECDNGQTINRKICFNPQTMSQMSCKKPLPTSPPLHKKLKESDLTNLIKRLIVEEVGLNSDCPDHSCNDGDSCAEHHDDDCGNYECIDGCCHAMCDNSKTKEDGGKSFLKKKNYWKKPTRKILKVRKHESRGKQGYGWDR